MKIARTCWNGGPRARMKAGGGQRKAVHEMRSRQPTGPLLRLALNSLFRKPHLPDAVHLSRDYEWKVDFKIFIGEKILILRKKKHTEIFRMTYSCLHLLVTFTEQV